MNSAARGSLAVVVILTACGGGGNGGTPPPPASVFTSLTVSPATAAMVDGDTVQLSATPRDQNGAAMTGLPAATFTLTSGTSVTVSGTGRVIAQAPGASTITASLTSGGTTRTATANATVTALGTVADVTVSGGGQSFNPQTVKIATGGSVIWTFTSGANSPHNVTFATTHPQGNIGNTTTGSATRSFATAGEFNYQCTLHNGMSGEVIVRDP